MRECNDTSRWPRRASGSTARTSRFAATLAALLEEKAVDTGQRGIAVAVNGAMVPRAAWPQTTLQPGDSVEIVRARQGG